MWGCQLQKKAFFSASWRPLGFVGDAWAQFTGRAFWCLQLLLAWMRQTGRSAAPGQRFAKAAKAGAYSSADLPARLPHLLKVQAHFTDEGACSWRWFRRPAGAGAKAGWAEISGAVGRRYTPGPEDAGCTLRVECTPGRRCAAPRLDSLTFFRHRRANMALHVAGFASLRSHARSTSVPA